MAAAAKRDGPRYALDLSPAERARYRFIAQRAVLLESERWRQYGVVPGARVADVGCGPGAVLVELARLVGDAGVVVGVEPGAEPRAAAAEEIEAAGLTNARVIEGRADDTGLAPASQDVVMVRLVLFHVGAGAQAAVDHLTTLLRPGGHLYLVDVDATGVRFSVHDPDVAEAADRYREFQRRRGCDIAIGPRLGSPRTSVSPPPHIIGSMELERRLRRVGGSVMVPLPPEMLAEAGLGVGQVVRLRSRPGVIAIEAVDVPSSGVVTFAARFLDRYREDLGRLDAG